MKVDFIFLDHYGYVSLPVSTSPTIDAKECISNRKLAAYVMLEKIQDALLRREIPMVWGTTTDRQTPEINLSQYAIEIKCLTLKDRTSYLISDG